MGLPIVPVPVAAAGPATPDAAEPMVGDPGALPGDVVDGDPDAPSSCWVVESMDALSWAMVCWSEAICFDVCSPEPVLNVAGAGGRSERPT